MEFIRRYLDKPAKKDKYLSIITNFGCHFNCPYCIVKNNGIDVPKTTMESLLYLEDAVKETRANIISISGGGDPLHNYNDHKNYYDFLYRLCDEMQIPLELHTSYTRYPGVDYNKFHRVVYHLHDIKALDNTISSRWDVPKHIIRVVFVVTEDFTPEKIMNIVAEVKKRPWISELSFRQMVDDHYKATDYCQEFLRKGHKKWWYYIEQRDYNDYFVNGKIFKKFSEIHSEV